MTLRSDRIHNVFKCPHCKKEISESDIASHLGKVSAAKAKSSRGKKKTSAYFKSLQAKRKTRTGGRPPKEK